MAHPGGRPSKYDDKYCAMLIEFYNKPSTYTSHKTVTLRSGTTIEEEAELPNKPSHVIDFCDSIGIGVSTFYDWIKEHKEFSDAYTHAKEYLARNIVDNALLNNYNAGFASLVAKNWLGWKDRTQVDEKSEVTHKFEDLTDEQLEAAIKARKDRIA